MLSRFSLPSGLYALELSGSIKLTYNSVKEKVNMSELPRTVTILRNQRFTYSTVELLGCFLNCYLFREGSRRAKLIFIQLQYTALTPGSGTPLFSIAGQ